MSILTLSAGTALAEREDDFSLDLRIVHSTLPVMGDCNTSDGCGQTCAGSASACESYTDDPS